MYTSYVLLQLVGEEEEMNVCVHTHGFVCLFRVF
jgi:hypothetical protein